MISANLVRDLREKTGAGMMDCKRALVETNGDFEAAVDWLRAKGLAAAAKKAGRVTAEGLTALMISGNKGAAIELNSETDFVAMNDQFQSLVSDVVKEAINHKSLESLLSAKLPGGKSVEEEVKESVAVIGENLNLRRMGVVSVTNGVVAAYVHNSVSPNMGKISVLVGIESNATDKAALEQLGKQIAMHIAASKPQSLDLSGIDPSLVERERNIFIEQSRASGKPDNIIEKMVDGRIRKFYEEVVLLEQVFVIDGKTRISDVLKEASSKLGSEVKIASFVRLELGEGVEVEESDFASEVAAAAGN